jgi:hypothetical protein
MVASSIREQCARTKTVSLFLEVSFQKKIRIRINHNFKTRQVSVHVMCYQLQWQKWSHAWRAFERVDL